MKRKKAFSLRNSLRASWPGRVAYHIGMGTWNFMRFRNVAFHHLLDKSTEGKRVSPHQYENWCGVTALAGFGGMVGLGVCAATVSAPVALVALVYSTGITLFNFVQFIEGPYNVTSLLERNSRGRQKLLSRNKDAERKITL